MAAVVCAWGMWCSAAAPVMVEATVQRRAFQPDGKAFVHVQSSCAVTIYGPQRHIRWAETPLRREEYWISSEGQLGFTVAPLMVDFTKEMVSQTECGTNAVVAYDVQPRWASHEVRVIALSLLDSNLFGRANARGFLAPWGMEHHADALCFRPRVKFSHRPPGLPETVEICFDAARWNQAMCRWGPKKGDRWSPPLPDGETLGRLSVQEWLEIGELTLPKAWVFHRYAEFPEHLRPRTNGLYLLEMISLTAHKAVSVSGFPDAPRIPERMAVLDFRAASNSMRGLYIDNRSVFEAHPTTRQSLLDERRRQHEDAMREIFGGKAEVQAKRWYGMLLLLLPLMVFPAVFLMLRKKPVEPEPSKSRR